MQKEESDLQKTGSDDCWKTIGVWAKGDVERCPKLTEVIHCRNCPVYAAAGRRLLDQPLPDSYRNILTSQLAENNEPEPTDIKTAFVFRAGSEWLAITAKLIQEVVDMGIIHTLPHISTNVLRGIVNIRGKLEICVSIGGVLGIERQEKNEHPTNYVAPERLVVAKHLDHVITFPVSEVLGNVRYRPEMLRELPVTVSGSKAVYTKGILCIGNRDIGFLKDTPLFKTLTKDLK